jgi:hypothetical protein
VQKYGGFNDFERTLRAMSCSPVQEVLLCCVERQNFAIFAERSFSASLRNVTKKERKGGRERERERETDEKKIFLCLGKNNEFVLRHGIFLRFFVI